MSNSTKTFKKFVLGLSFVALSTTASLAQDYVFKVMASNGNVTQKSPAKRLWAGSQLQGNDLINVPDKGYVGLMHKNGRTIELKAAGNYKISDLASKVGGSSSITSKYANYVAGEMSKADKVDINKNHRKYSSITGSVSRTIVIGNVFAYFPLSLDTEKEGKEAKEATAMYDGSEFVLHFYPNPEQNPSVVKFDTYFVSVLDMTNKEVARYETKEESIKIDLTKLKFKYEPSWVINVSRNAETFKKGDVNAYHVSLLSKEDAHYKKVTADLKEIGEAETALDKLTQARVFEEHKLLQDAIRCHEQAIAMQPEVATFKVAYDEFLVRNRIRYIQKAGFSEDIMKDDSKASAIIVEEEKKEEVKPARKTVVAPKKGKKGRK